MMLFIDGCLVGYDLTKMSKQVSAMFISWRRLFPTGHRHELTLNLVAYIYNTVMRKWSNRPVHSTGINKSTYAIRFMSVCHWSGIKTMVVWASRYIAFEDPCNCVRFGRELRHHVVVIYGSTLYLFHHAEDHIVAGNKTTSWIGDVCTRSRYQRQRQIIISHSICGM